jgi:WD40 repeat protein
MVSRSDVWDARFDAGGDLIATASGDGIVRLWNAATGTLVRELRGHKEEVVKLAFSPRSDHLVSGSADGNVIIWDLSQGTIVSNLGEHSGGVQSVAFNGDGTLIVTAIKSGLVEIWDATSRNVRASLRQHEGAVMSAEFGPVTGRIISSGVDGQVIVTELSDQAIEITDDTVTGLVTAFSPDDASFIVGYSNGKLESRRSNDGAIVSSFHRNASPFLDVKFPACAKGPVTASFDRTVRIWDSDKLAYGKEVQAEAVPDKILIDPNCKMIAVVLNDGRIEIRTFETGVLQHLLGDHSADISAVEFSQDGNYLAAGDVAGRLRLWNLTTGSMVERESAHQDRIIGLGFTGDNVITASWDGLLKTWSLSDLKSGTYAASGSIASVSMERDRAVMAVGGWDGRVAIWSLSPLRKVREWQAQQTPVISIDYQGSSNLILTGSSDGASILWNASSGELISSMSDKTDAVTKSEFSSKGEWMLTIVAGRKARVRHGLGTLGDQLAEARTYLPRSALTSEERRRFSISVEDGSGNALDR